MQKLRSNDIKFDTDRDAYILSANPTLALRRCTEFVGSFFEPFAASRVSRQMVSATGRYQGRTASSLQRGWEAARRKGVEVHEDIAKSIDATCLPEAGKARRAIDWLYAEYPADRYSHTAEAIVYDEALALAGTIDLIISSTSSNRHTLIDWKTTRSIDKRSLYHKYGIRGPARAWEDCNYIKYVLQLSLYRFLIEANYGLAIDEQYIAHLTDTSIQLIPCEYMRREVEQLLEFDGLRSVAAPAPRLSLARQ